LTDRGDFNVKLSGSDFRRSSKLIVA